MKDSNSNKINKYKSINVSLSILITSWKINGCFPISILLAWFWSHLLSLHLLHFLVPCCIWINVIVISVETRYYFDFLCIDFILFFTLKWILKCIGKKKIRLLIVDIFLQQPLQPSSCKSEYHSVPVDQQL